MGLAWFAFALYLLIGVVSGVINIGWEDCGSTKARAKVKCVTVSPASPMPGDNITVVASVDIDRATAGISSDLIGEKVCTDLGATSEPHVLWCSRRGRFATLAAQVSR